MWYNATGVKTIDATDAAAIRAANRGTEPFTLALTDGARATVRPAPLAEEVLTPDQYASCQANADRGDYHSMAETDWRRDFPEVFDSD